MTTRLLLREIQCLCKSICHVWHTVNHNISWNIENGRHILFWKDSWLANYGPLFNHITKAVPGEKINYIVAYMVDARGN